MTSLAPIRLGIRTAPTTFALGRAWQLIQYDSTCSLPRQTSWTTANTYKSSPSPLCRFYATPPKQRFTRVSKIKPDRLPQNDEIQDYEVLIIEPNGSLSGPHDPRVVTSRLNLNTHVLRMIETAIVPPPPRDPDLPIDPDAPIPPEPRPALCRIVLRAEEYKLAKQTREQKREEKEQGKGKKRLKEVELSWSIGPHDLERKVRQAITFLQKGMKVEFIIATKKKKGSGRNKPDEDNGSEEKDRETVNKIRDMIKLVPGSVEPKQPTGDLGRTMRMFFEGTILPEEQIRDILERQDRAKKAHEAELAKEREEAALLADM